jgi:hypothetical protein
MCFYTLKYPCPRRFVIARYEGITEKGGSFNGENIPTFATQLGVDVKGMKIIKLIISYRKFTENSPKTTHKYP